MTFAGARTPPPDRFRDGDFWRDPLGRLHSVRPAAGIPGGCLLRPISGGHSLLLRRVAVRGWVRSSWGQRA